MSNEMEDDMTTTVENGTVPASDTAPADAAAETRETGVDTDAAAGTEGATEDTGASDETDAANEAGTSDHGKKREPRWKSYHYSSKYKKFWAIYWGVTLALTIWFSKAIILGDTGLERAADSKGPVILVLTFIAVLASAGIAAFILKPMVEKDTAHVKTDRKGREKIKNKSYQMKPYHLLIMLAVDIYCFWIMEYVNNPDFSLMQFKYMVMNVAGIFIINMILLLWLNSMNRAAVVTLLTWTSFAIAFYLVYTFRGEPMQAIDFFSIWTATTVIGNYTTTMTRGLSLDIIFALCILGIFLNMRHYVVFKKGLIRKILMRVVVAIFMVAMVPFYLEVNWNGAAGIVTDLFAPYKTYKEVGTTVGFFCVAKYMRLTPPDGYSVSETTKIAEEASKDQDPNTTTDVKPVNIICIMNESWGDYEYGGNFTTNKPIMPFYDSLTENTIKGHNMVCIIGGGTAKTEYEFLTGNSVKRFPAMVPYVSYFTHSQYSLVSTLKSQGYTCYAMHPYKGSNWNRPTAYKLLGFDHFYTIDDFDTANATYYHSHISDQTNYEKIIDMVNNKKNKDDPLFLFDITMQNHGGYSADDVDRTITVDGLDDYMQNKDDLAVVERYLSLVNLSDQALEYLIDYFKDYDEPTIICMWGDHCPSMPDDFYRYIAGDSLENLPLEEKQKFYSTPFFIWANYDIPEEQDVVTSTNYLSTMLLEQTGLQMTDYNYYLKNLQKDIPALNHFGYLGTDGQYYTWENGSQDVLQNEWNYECLQYNELAEMRKRLKWFFTLDG